MTMKRRISLFIALFWQSTARAQTLDVSTCIGSLTAATACNSYQSILTECNSYTGSRAAACYCPQTVLNAIAGCQSEFRICIAGNRYDSDFEGPNGLFGLWHSACDDVLTYKPTKPAITSLTMTFDAPNCLSAESYCQNFGSLTDACTASSASDLQSCLCRPTVLDLASRCQVDGSISCLFKTPTTTNLFSYKQCGGSKGSTSVGSMTTTQVPVTSQVSVPVSKAQPSSSPTSTIPPPTSTSKNSAQRILGCCSPISASAAGLIAICFAFF